MHICHPSPPRAGTLQYSVNPQFLARWLGHIAGVTLDRACNLLEPYAGRCVLGLSTSTSTFTGTCGFIYGKTCTYKSPVCRYPALKFPTSPGVNFGMSKYLRRTRHPPRRQPQSLLKNLLLTIQHPAPPLSHHFHIHTLPTSRGLSVMHLICDPFVHDAPLIHATLLICAASAPLMSHCALDCVATMVWSWCIADLLTCPPLLMCPLQLGCEPPKTCGLHAPMHVTPMTSPHITLMVSR